MPADEPSSAIQTRHVADRLIERCDTLGAPVCVGIDPVYERLPVSLQALTPPEAISRFCTSLISQLSGVVPCLKFQSACFERHGGRGMTVLRDVCRAARRRGFVVILDAKRGDIGLTAEHYAHSAFGCGESENHDERVCDWLTVNGYLGPDTLQPFLDRSAEAGILVLVRTSNPGAAEVQDQRMENGLTVAEHMARIVARVGDDRIGERGYSTVGAVVGATAPEAAARLRGLMPRQLFLVPGFGAQGGSVDDVLPCFNSDGRGAIVTASRSIIYTTSADDPAWESAVADAAAQFAEQIGCAAGLRR